MSKLLVDTNILVYAKDVSSMYHARSLSIFNSSNELFLTTKNVTEYYAVVTKGEKPLLSPANALQDIQEFTTICTLLYPNELSHHQLLSFIKSYQPKGILIHDVEIAAIALVNGVTRIATFNKEDFQSIVEIEVIVP